MALQVQAPVAVTNAGFTPIVAKAFARYVEIQEDGSAPPAGIIVLWPNGNTTQYPVAEQPIKIGNPGGGSGPLLGSPFNFGGHNEPATVYCSVKSVGATSKIQVSETN